MIGTIKLVPKADRNSILDYTSSTRGLGIYCWKKRSITTSSRRSSLCHRFADWKVRRFKLNIFHWCFWWILFKLQLFFMAIIKLYSISWTSSRVKRKQFYQTFLGIENTFPQTLFFLPSTIDESPQTLCFLSVVIHLYRHDFNPKTQPHLQETFQEWKPRY